MMRLRNTLITRAAMVLASAAMIATSTLAAGSPDTSANAMITGGAFSKQQLINRLQQGDGRHSANQLQREFRTYGVSVTAIKSSDTVMGSVTRSGNVIVNGKVVATNAQSYGRTSISGSTKVGDLYRRPTSVSFESSSLPAFVNMHNGVFQFAIIESCGNLVTAKPKPAPKPKPKPTAAKPAKPVINVVQTQAQAQAQAPVATASAQAAPAPAATTATAAASLPQTGPIASGLVGLAALITAAWYYLRSRRELTWQQKHPRR